jgi:hypothetical protein
MTSASPALQNSIGRLPLVDAQPSIVSGSWCLQKAVVTTDMAGQGTGHEAVSGAFRARQESGFGSQGWYVELLEEGEWPESDLLEGMLVNCGSDGQDRNSQLSTAGAKVLEVRNGPQKELVTALTNDLKVKYRSVEELRIFFQERVSTQSRPWGQYGQQSWWRRILPWSWGEQGIAGR